METQKQGSGVPTRPKSTRSQSSPDRSANWVDFRTVKAAVTMEMILAHYNITLRKSGQELRGRCPIHQGEGSDTFHVSLVKNIFNCFSGACKAKGNVLDFVAAMEKCTVRDAALKLKEWFALPAGDPSKKQPEPKPELATKKKEPVAESAAANKPLTFRLRGIDHAHPYIKERGIDPETAERFGIGYYGGKGSMAGRIVIPIENEKGELVAYAGRSIDGSEPKYKLPAGFHKSQGLFNLAAVVNQGATWAVLVEGYFDCIRVAQARFPCVALMGCTLSDEQESLLARHFRRLPGTPLKVSDSRPS